MEDRTSRQRLRPPSGRKKRLEEVEDDLLSGGLFGYISPTSNRRKVKSATPTGDPSAESDSDLHCQAEQAHSAAQQSPSPHHQPLPPLTVNQQGPTTRASAAPKRKKPPSLLNNPAMAASSSRYKAPSLEDDDEEEENTTMEADFDALRISSGPSKPAPRALTPPTATAKSPVEFLHHDSPVGPAVSVFPRGYKPDSTNRLSAAAANSGFHVVSDSSSDEEDHGQQERRYQPRYPTSSRQQTGSSSPYYSTRSSSSPRHHDCRPQEDDAHYYSRQQQRTTRTDVVPERYSPSSSYTRSTPSSSRTYSERSVPQASYQSQHRHQQQDSHRHHHQQAPPVASSRGYAAKAPPRMVEIAPGVQVPLRGAQETQACVARDFFMPSLCIACQLEFFCISDAAYVLCPQCRVVNPMSGSSSTSSQHGLGLGFTFTDLQAMKREPGTSNHRIMSDHRSSSAETYRRPAYAASS